MTDGPAGPRPGLGNRPERAINAGLAGRGVISGAGEMV